MKFSKVCEYFNKLEDTSSRLSMTSILNELFLECEPENIDKLIYFCQGKVGPKYKGLEVNIGEAAIISLIARYLGQSEEKIKEELLKVGDLGLIIERTPVTKQQQTLFSKELSFLDVYLTFEKIADISGKGTVEQKQKLFEYILFNVSQREGKYVVKFPISFRLGFSDSTIVDALSLLDSEVEQKISKEIITNKYNQVSDLGFIAKIIKVSGIKGLDKVKITPGIPIKPALCERASGFPEIIERLGKDKENKVIKFGVDSKIDGFRQQIHKFGSQVKIFSRNEEDMTKMFPDIVCEIKKIEGDFIIDSESIAFDSENQKYHSFQITIQRKRKYDIAEKAKELPLHLKVFDILYLNGKEMLDVPFKDRRKIVEEKFNIPPIIKPTELIITDKEEELESFFNSRIAENLEGIIAKDLSSKYTAGGRGFSWIKFKKSYQGTIDTIDAVILGAFYGQGKRSDKGLGALLVGIYSQETGKYYTLAKVGTGLSDELLLELGKELSDIKVNRRPDEVVTNIDPDYYVIPKIIIEVNYDEITESEMHTCCFNRDKRTGLALRFPRLVKVRSDKEDQETTTEVEIRRMYELQGKTKEKE